jgi:23S rRNA (pseudouridine1915-N3)-methyltransferase
MKITLLTVGKTDDPNIEHLVDTYAKRLNHYVNFETVLIPGIKNTKSLSKDQQKNDEGKRILSKLENSDFVSLLDERGKKFTSLKFAELLNKRGVSGLKHLVFIIGGPYGVSNNVYERANDEISLSDMTFSHQMVRLFTVEQLYRAFTILKNEPYHHE